MRCHYFFLAALLTLTAAAGNLLDNPSFEAADPDNPALPERWNKMQHLTLGKHHYLDDAMASDGTRSVRLENRDPAVTVQSYVLFMQDRLAAPLNRIPAGTEMELSADVRADSPDVRFRMYLEGATTAGAATNFISPDFSAPVDRWERRVFRFKQPETGGFGSAFVCLQLLNTGKLWLDNVYLGEAGQAPAAVGTDGNLLRNPSAEEVDGNGLPVAWEPLQLDFAAGFQAVDDRVTHTGNRSLAIRCDLPELSDRHYVRWQQNGLAEALRQVPPGTPMTLSLWANTGSNPSVHFRFYLELRRGDEFIGTFISPPVSSDVGWKPFQVDFIMPETEPTSAYVCLQLLTPGNVWFDDLYLGKREESSAVALPAAAVDYFRVTDFPPQATWFAPERPKSLTLAYELARPGSFTVVLQTLDGRELRRYEETAAEVSGSVTLALPELGKGGYELNYGDAGSDFFRIIEPYERGVRFDAANRMTLNGKPFFPLMVLTPEMSEDALSVYQQAGFNSIAFGSLTVNPEAARYLAQTAARYDLAVVDWGNPGDRAEGTLEEVAARLASRIATARTLDNFIGWLDDESEMRLIPWENLANVYRVIYAAAPEYVVWQNHAPRLTATSGPYGTYANVRRYSQVCDVTGVDIYPVPEGGGHSELENRTVSCVGEYTDLVRSTVAGKKPVWMVLQAGSWGEEGGGKADARNPRPSYEQLRFMCYNALTHGATGWIFYGPGSLGRDTASDYMGTLADVLQEFRALESFVSTGTPVTVHVDAAPPELRIAGYEADGEYLAILVNEGKNPLRVTPRLPGNRPWFLSPAGSAFAAGGNVELKANGVVILSTVPVKISRHGAFQPRSALHSGPVTGSMNPVAWRGQWAAHPALYNTPERSTFARQSLKLPGRPGAGVIRITGDDAFRFSVNGTAVGSGSNHTIAYQFDITPYLREKDNELAFELINHAGLSGLLFEGSVRCGEEEILFASGPDTEFSADGEGGWLPPLLSGSPPVQPWGAVNLVVYQ